MSHWLDELTHAAQRVAPRNAGVLFLWKKS
jgi:hypothetical protein